MARIFITGSTEGLGRAAAQTLMQQGHRVVLHARNPDRAVTLDQLVTAGADVVIGDLSDRTQTVDIAGQVNDLGRMDAVIHNAGLYTDAQPFRTTEGHPRVLAVNVLAPYLLTALMHRPDRLVYVTSDMHQSGTTALDDLDWTRRPWNPTQAYCDSKLLVTAVALAVARRWPQARSNAVDPGWVPTRMGGPHATDNLELGSTTQVWLATSNDPAAGTTGAYWHHQRQLTPAPAASDPRFQERVLNNLAEITGSALSAG